MRGARGAARGALMRRGSVMRQQMRGAAQQQKVSADSRGSGRCYAVDDGKGGCAALRAYASKIVARRTRRRPRFVPPPDFHCYRLELISRLQRHHHRRHSSSRYHRHRPSTDRHRFLTAALRNDVHAPLPQRTQHACADDCFVRDASRDEHAADAMARRAMLPKAPAWRSRARTLQQRSRDMPLRGKTAKGAAG